MFNSLKRWVQDVTVDLNPSLPPLSSSTATTISSPSSPSYLSLSSKPRIIHPYSYSTASSNERLAINPSSSSKMGLSRPISMDNVRSTKLINTFMPPPPPASPGELDLSHLNREEQEHIANVLRRARAADEQQISVPPVIVHSIQSPPASIVSASLSPSASLSSSTSTSTSDFNSEKPEKYEPNDKNTNIDNHEIYKDQELSTSPSLESITAITIHRCQVCNEEQQMKENTPICRQCQNDEEIAQLIQNNTIPHTSIRKSSSPVQIEWNENENENDKIYDSVIGIDQELIKQNSPIEEYASHLVVPHCIDNMNDNQEQNEDEDEEEEEEEEKYEDGGKQLCQSSNLESSLPMKIRSNNLTEIDENDFFYQGPSSYIAAIDDNQMLDKNEEVSIPSYKIDEYIDEDDNDERDHVKELEETIANLSKHLPLTSSQVNNTETTGITTNLHQPSSLSVGKIDIDSILEMEIESPSTDEQYIESSSSNRPCSVSSQHPLNVPITVPISFNNNPRISLSRSSGVRENLTDLLSMTTGTSLLTDTATAESTTPQESYYSDHRPLQRTASTYGKRMILPMHRQKRNLPSVPSIMDQLQLRRVNSESRFSLPAVPPTILITNSNIDDESDLLEIDLNDPSGSKNRAARSKTESELANNSNQTDSHLRTLSTTNQLLSMDEIVTPRKPIKQLRDQTTNTPPISSLTSSFKMKKKLKKKGSSSPSNTNGHHTTSTHTNGQISPTRTNPLPIVVPSTTPNTNRPKLQKSTSTDMLYPFPVSKLLLSHDNMNPSCQDGTDLGLRITGGHSIANCMEVTARIEHIDTEHRNYNILKNAVQEGDEVLEVGGVSLRGKSALFVQKLMNSIQNEFEIIVRSKHVIPPILPPIEIHNSEKIISNNYFKSNLPISQNSLTVDTNTQRRHSMDTSQLSLNHSNNNTIVKSQSKIDNLNKESDQFLVPANVRKKRVSSKECLFSVESLHRGTVTTKSNEHLMKIATQSSDTKHIDDGLHNSLVQERKQQLIKRHEKEVVPLVKQTSLNITTPENKYMNEDTINLNNPLQPRRLYEHRNSLLPNDPGLNGAGSKHHIDRQNSNESDESDNLSQYFLSPSSRKSSLLPTNEITTTTDFSREHKPSIASMDNETAIDASRRLQKFIRTSEDNRQPRRSIGDASMAFQKTEGRKSSISAFGSFKFKKKKKDSIDLSNQPNELRENDYVGDIELQIGHNSEREQLVVRVIQAKNLLAKDTNGYSDPFVKVYLLPGRDQENKRRTKHIPKNLNPIWEHTVVYGNMHREELQYKMLEFTLWDYDRFKANDFLGQVTIDLKDAKVIDDKPHWYRLQALRSRDEISNRGSSPRLFKMTSTDSTASSSSVFIKTNVNVQSSNSQRK